MPWTPTRGTYGPVTAFVLSAGAGLGCLQAAMLQALYEQGVTADMLVATSAGAINAAFVASRPQTVATARALGAVWRGLRREDVFPVSVSALVGGLCGRRDHLVPDRELRRLIRRHLEFADLADAPVPLHLVACDLADGQEVLLSSGPAEDALVAASAIPGIFSPVEIAGRRLVDGGVVNHTPISHAVALGAERIYVLPTQEPCRRLARVPRTALDVALHGLGVLFDTRLEADVSRYASDAELILLPAPNRVGAQPTSFEHASVLMGDALAACRSVLAADRGLRSVA
jgi:NTE family protein